MNTMIIAISDRQAVLAAINTKDLSQNLVKVRSSNVWAYGLNIKDRKDKTGDLVVQFKNKNGGAGDELSEYIKPATDAVIQKYITEFEYISIMMYQL